MRSTLARFPVVVFALLLCTALGAQALAEVVSGSSTVQDEDWNAAVWLVPEVPSNTAHLERSLSVIEVLVNIDAAYVRTGRLEEAAQYYEAYQLMLETNGLPRWARGLASFDRGAALLQMGRHDAGLEALRDAARLGFTEPTSFHEMVPRRLWNEPAVRAVYGAMRIGPEDLHEIAWARQEIAAVNHETGLMIAFNMGRKDEGWTRVLGVDLPTRRAESPAVEAYRQALRFVQRRQLLQVMQSDQIRRSHLTTMLIINGDGVPERERLASARAAELRDQAQRKEIGLRQYGPPDSSGLRDVPPLGSLEVEQSFPALKSAPPLRQGGVATPWRDAKVGDWWQFTQRHANDEGVFYEGKAVQWVTGRRGASLALVSLRSTEEGPVVDDVFTRVFPTFPAQLQFDYSVEAPIELVDYQEAETAFNYEGAQVRALNVTAQFHWTQDGERELWTLRGILAPDVVPSEFVELELEKPNFKFSQTLVGWGPGSEKRP